MIWLIAVIALFSLPMLFRGWLGWRYGAPAEMRHVIVHLFAVLVAVRYWQPFTEMFSNVVTFDPRFIAIGAFGCVYAIAAAVAGVAVQIKGEIFQTVKRDYLSQVLGLCAGLFTGSILGGSLALLLSLAMPAEVSSEEANVPEEVLRWPLILTENMETKVARVSRDSSAHTRFPALVPAEESAPEGEVKLVWQ